MTDASYRLVCEVLVKSCFPPAAGPWCDTEALNSFFFSALQFFANTSKYFVNYFDLFLVRVEKRVEIVFR